ncbi:MAG: septum formation protein Maf [Idiomarinaceae bacterium HL-53]|nr:MAG: septum formation protein Maf [Idiomarinaceae bacterium HL-53]CUS47443.1 septum formation protein [Idiomarinaceae bacterium HL-53]
MKQLCLASASPRRRELLSMLPIEFTVQAVDIVEARTPGERPKEYVSRLAREKAEAGLARFPDTTWVIGSDTIVCLGDRVFEKPNSFADFESMMHALSGKTHSVLTAVCLASRGAKFETLVQTRVEFRVLSAADIIWYWQTEEPKDKAGGYGIQGLGGRFVARIEGSYSAVVGLPLCETEALLQQAELLR